MSELMTDVWVVILIAGISAIGAMIFLVLLNWALGRERV
jgi:hypothetical protein